MAEKILQAIKELREKSKKRKFAQTFDLIIVLREFDIKKPENKFSEDIVLPHGRGKEGNVVVFSDTIKDIDCEVLNSANIQNIGKNKREIRRLVSSTDFFLSEPQLMPLIGKSFGQFLGPKGKMPKLISGDVKKLVEDYKKSVRIKIRDSPVIQCMIGSEQMDDESVIENINAVLKFLETKLPKGKHNIGKLLIKLTMSNPIKIEV
jgi:large subunit ribosomal protein L1